MWKLSKIHLRNIHAFRIIKSLLGPSCHFYKEPAGELFVTYIYYGSLEKFYLHDK